jgi:hypothetical protein
MFTLVTNGMNLVYGIAEYTVVRLIIGPDEINEIVHVDIDVVVHFENEVDLGAVLPHPVEHGDAFKR